MKTKSDIKNGFDEKRIYEREIDRIKVENKDKRIRKEKHKQDVRK